jgi:3-deoxy-D-manno-octulosonic-acid transferase
MIRFFYNLLFPVALLFFLPGILVKMVRRGNYRHKFGQRFGFYDRALRDRLRGGDRTWIHAVSVGEVMIALKLAEKLRELEPALRVVLTTTTTTGFAIATKDSPEWIEVLYNPLDFWPVMQRAFHVIHPQRVILVEAEVWPNLAAEAYRRSLPLALVNARLSTRSERRFRKFRFAIAPTFRLLDLVCVQESEDVPRWEALGVDLERIEVVGSIKFDRPQARPDPEMPREVLARCEIDPERPIFFAGSTHAGEERIAAEIFLNLRSEFPDLFLIIAPRHFERTVEIQRMLESLGLRVALRTDASMTSSRMTKPDCFILNAMGELQHWYAVGTVVFVGKTLTAHGGQNPVEPIAAGCPVIFGPNMGNFATLARSLVERGGAIQVANETELRESVARLLRDEPTRRRLVENARDVLRRHDGATLRTAEFVTSLRSRARAGRGAYEFRK